MQLLVSAQFFLFLVISTVKNGQTMKNPCLTRKETRNSTIVNIAHIHLCFIFLFAIIKSLNIANSIHKAPDKGVFYDK